MVLDKLSELANPLLKKCPYTANCENEGIRACYEDYEACTIYQRNKTLNQRAQIIGITPLSRIERIVG